MYLNKKNIEELDRIKKINIINEKYPKIKEFINNRTKTSSETNEFVYQIKKLLKKEKYTKMYETLEQVMLEKKNIHPNVDFPCGPTYYMMGIDIDFYTPIFVMSRITGWSAHIMEQHASNKLIRPLSKYRGEEVREVMLLNQR